jgi:cation/acetate symporter
MHDSANEEMLIDRESLDGRIAATAAAFGLGYAFFALLDRVGAPERVVSVISPFFTIAALTLLGFLLHSMRISRYYAAGRAVPACYAGFANAAIVIGLALPFVANLTEIPVPFGALSGFLIGVAGVAWVAGPLLRKTGAFSLSELLAARFSSFQPRLGMIAATAAASALVALAGYQRAVDALTNFTQIGRSFSAVVIGVAILLVAGPGGLSGVIWTASVAAAVTVAGFGLPILALWWRGVAPPLPFLGDRVAWDAALTHLEAWRVVAPASGVLIQLATMLAVALGVFTLAPVLAPAITTPDEAAARRAGYASFGWTLALAGLIAASVALSALAISRVSEGQTPEHLPDTLYAASSRGFVKICNARVVSPASARQACAESPTAPSKPLRAQDVSARGEYLIGGLPLIERLGAAASGLAASALVALGLALAASGLQACATALGHEAMYRLRGETALTSRRLATTRLVLIVVTAIGLITSATGAFDAATLVGFALALSTACIAPLVALSFWPRAGDRDAVVSLLGGFAGMALVILVAGPGAPGLEVLVWAALGGFVAGMAGGVSSALRSRAEAPENVAFVNRILRGDGEIFRPDKGA